MLFIGNEPWIIAMNIVIYLMMAIMIAMFFWTQIAPHTRLTKKFVGAFDCGDSWDLIGVYGISEEHIMKKIKRLHKKGIILEPRWGVDRMVETFPDHCTHLY